MSDEICNSNIVSENGNAQALVIQSNINVSKKEVMTGIFKYTSNYTMPQNILPKIQNIIVFKNLSVSIDFHYKGNLEPIYQAINIIAKSLEETANYFEENRTLPGLDRPVGNKVIRIDSHIDQNIYYLYNLYYPISRAASELIHIAMLDIYKHKNKDKVNEFREKLTLDLEVWSDYTEEDEQVLLNNISNNGVVSCDSEQEELYAARIRRFIGGASAEQRQNYLDVTMDVLLISSMRENLPYWSPELVRERSYDKKHQEVAEMLDDPDQCLTYLNGSYPLLYPAVIKVMDRMNDTITSFENARGEGLYYKTISWTSSTLDFITNSFYGKTVKFGSGAILGILKIGALYNPTLKSVMALTSLSFLAMDYTQYISDELLRKSSITQKVTINHERLIKHFTCKFTLSNGNKKLGDLDDHSLETIGDVFAKHVYYTTIQDSREYQDQSSYTNYLLEQLSNSSHVTAINLDKEFSNFVFNANTNETAIIRELVGHYNESACFDNIIL